MSAGESSIRAAISQPKTAMPATSIVRQIGRNESAENKTRNTRAAPSPLPRVKKLGPLRWRLIFVSKRKCYSKSRT